MRNAKLPKSEIRNPKSEIKTPLLFLFQKEERKIKFWGKDCIICQSFY